jgi:hypothetical protein
MEHVKFGPTEHVASPSSTYPAEQGQYFKLPTAVKLLVGEEQLRQFSS